MIMPENGTITLKGVLRAVGRQWSVTNHWNRSTSGLAEVGIIMHYDFQIARLKSAYIHPACAV